MRYETNPKRRGQPDTGTDGLARGLGIFSIALGALELIAGGVLAKKLGTRSVQVRGYGAREFANGIGILAAKDPMPWIWGRVGGDLLDIGALMNAERRRAGEESSRIASLIAVLGVTAVDLYCAMQLTRESRIPLQPVHDYSNRSGWPMPADSMRGAAWDFKVPEDMQAPALLRAWS